VVRTGRRLTVLLLALALIGIPAAVLRIGCVGKSCRSEAAAAAAPAPFCSLPADLRTLITAGTYDGRSPDVIGVGGSTPVVTNGVPWPSEATSADAGSVDLEFVGRGIHSGRPPAEVSLDQVAPTLEPLLGLHRPHPEVRAGKAIPGVVRSGAHTPLVVLIVRKGVGSSGLRPPLPRVPSGVHIAEARARTGALPNDPIAVETTIGTGGLPSQHGITGALIRNDDGKVVRAFGPRSPQPVIATLGDDLDRATGGRALIGLIGTTTDLGSTGDNWYHGGRIVDRMITPKPQVGPQVDPFLAGDWGADTTPDILAVALSSGVGEDDRTTGDIEERRLRAVPDATIVVAGTGSLRAPHAVTAPAPAGTDTVAAGGLFVEQGAPAQELVDGLEAAKMSDGSPLFTAAFASYAVRFGCYC